MEIKELLEKLGVSADKQEAGAAALREFLNGAYVPKSRFNEVNEEKNTLKAAVEGRDKQLEALKKATGDTDALKAEIKKLQDKNKADAEASDAKFRELRLSSAIKLAVAQDAQDADIVAGLIDKSKIILGEDGKVTGLEEQVKSLRESKAFLFKQAGTPPYNPHGGQPPTTNPWEDKTFNLTRQGEILKTNPEEARKLAAAAGKPF